MTLSPNIAPRLEIKLLGSFAMKMDGQLASGLNSSRLQSLLAFLVLHAGAPQARRHVAFLLWPDASEAQARTNLRKLIHQLRQTLPSVDGFLDSSGSFIQWRPDSPITSDVSEFKLAVDQGLFDKAVALYTGDLLPQCYDDWILAERERIKQIYLVALEQLARQKESAGDFPSALNHIHRLLQNDPLREETYRYIMRLHAQNGDRAAVLHTFQNCTTALKRELGVEPSGTTRRVFERLIDQSVLKQEFVPLAGQFPLVGRTVE